MRTPVLILGLVLVCGGLAVALLASQRPARAAREEPLERVRPPEGGDGGKALAPSRPPTPEPSLATAEAPPASTREASRREAETSALEEDLMAELALARERGWVSDRRLAEFLARIAIEKGDLARAFELLERVGSTDVGLYSMLAKAWQARGDAAGQARALLAALRIAPNQAVLLDQLSEVAPDLAIAELERRLAAAAPPGPVKLRARLARALAAAGRENEARRLVDALLREKPRDQQALFLLAELDPEAAIANVERLLGEAGDAEERQDALLAILGHSGNAAGAEQVLEHLARAGQEQHPDPWGQVAELWLSQGETERGVAALERALALEHDDPDSWVQPLHELAPEELLPILERRVANDEAHNDEYWGSLAEAYWFAGRPADARSAWERARALDPEDDEWPMRLAALERGRDPLGD